MCIFVFKKLLTEFHALLSPRICHDRFDRDNYRTLNTTVRYNFNIFGFSSIYPRWKETKSRKRLSSLGHGAPPQKKSTAQHFPYFLLKRTGIKKQNICTGNSFPKALLAPLPYRSHIFYKHTYISRNLSPTSHQHIRIYPILRKHIYSCSHFFVIDMLN